MKVFISMPMKSKSVEQVKQERDRFFKAIKKQIPSAELIDSVIDGADKEIAIKGDKTGVWYLGTSLQIMAKAEFVFFAPGWEEARGCKLERRVAESYGMYCYDLKGLGEIVS